MINWIDQLSNLRVTDSIRQLILFGSQCCPGKWEISQAQALASSPHTESSSFNNSLKTRIWAKISFASLPPLPFVKTAITQSSSPAQGSF